VFPANEAQYPSLALLGRLGGTRPSSALVLRDGYRVPEENENMLGRGR
jgi:hypothetical protein